jgi:hypothetical protein
MPNTRLSFSQDFISFIQCGKEVRTTADLRVINGTRETSVRSGRVSSGERLLMAAPFQALLDYLEGGQTLDEFLGDFPTVSREMAITPLDLAKFVAGRPVGMKVLLDECVPRKLKDALPDYECQTVPEAGLAGQKNGRLLSLAEDAGFEVFITMDGGLQHQQTWLAEAS